MSKKTEPLPPLVDGRVIVDHVRDYYEEEYYLRATSKRKPHYAVVRYAVPADLFADYVRAAEAKQAAIEGLDTQRIPIKEWKPDISVSTTEEG